MCFAAFAAVFLTLNSQNKKIFMFSLSIFNLIYITKKCETSENEASYQYDSLDNILR